MDYLQKLSDPANKMFPPLIRDFNSAHLNLYFEHPIFEYNSKHSYICSVTLLSMEEIHSACQDSVNGLPSRRPVIEMTIPSVLDKTISPPGT